MGKGSFLLAALAILSAAAHGYEPVAGHPYAHYVNEAMHADFEFHLYGSARLPDRESLRQAAEAAFASVRGLDKVVNYWDPASEISRVNREAAKGPVAVSETLFSLLAYCRKTWEDTQGASDVTVGPLVELWGFYKKQGHLPSDSELAAALQNVGMDKVVLDSAAQTVHFTVPGVRIDLGGIAKGLAVDRAAKALREKGVDSALLMAGTSSIVAIGTPPGLSGWTVKIRGPYNRADSVDQVLLRDQSLSTSAGYERFLEIGGKKYCHIFDPKTGRPAEGVYSVSVVGPTGLQTDALDTGFFVLGVAGARVYCERNPQVQVVVITDNNGRPEPVRINFEQRKATP